MRDTELSDLGSSIVKVFFTVVPSLVEGKEER